MYDMSGNSTGNIFCDQGSQFLQRTTISDQEYSVFRVAGFYNSANGAITPANFANIVFTLQIQYASNDQVVGTRTSNFDVFKR